jgi:hypothetical protein
LSTVLLAIIQEEANFQNNILPLWSFPVSEILAKLGVGTDFPQQLWKRQLVWVYYVIAISGNRVGYNLVGLALVANQLSAFVSQ